MSWDVMVFDYRGRPAPVDQMDSEPHLPLGQASRVRSSISRYLPGVDWTDSSWGDFEGEDFSIEFNMGKEDVVESIMLHVRGSGDPLPAMVAFARPNNWSLLDCTTGAFLDLEHPSPQGWLEFKAFRDRVAQTLGVHAEAAEYTPPVRRIWNRTILWGTNLLGVLPLALGMALVPLWEGASNVAKELMVVVVGTMTVVVDVVYRRAVLGERLPRCLFEYEEAGRLLFLPLWIWGIVWIFVGLGKAAFSG